jgi:murein DD-endopeptidase MepM/ murein hydrolase activator NlpD
MTFLFLVINLLFISTSIAETILEGNLIQGGLIFGTTMPGNSVMLENRNVRVSSNGFFVFGFSRDAKKSFKLIIKGKEPSSEARTLRIKRRKYVVQRINGLSTKMVHPSQKAQERIRDENKLIRQHRMRDNIYPFFKSGFIWPAKGRISGVYGSQRILNGAPKRPHYGIDIAAPTGTMVVAPADGTVVLAEPDLYYSGGTIIVDHGHGLTSAFLHMDKLFVSEGDMLSQSKPLGTIGSTGRTTGPHLDWRMNWFEHRIDPGLLVGHIGQP